MHLPLLLASLPSVSVHAADVPTLVVQPGDSITAALEAAPDAATLYISSGIYMESIVVRKPVTIIADGAVTVQWATASHYEPVVSIQSDDVTIDGLTIEHSSPSVADNFAIRLSHNAVLKNCTISSKTGTGIGVEDASSAVVLHCKIKDCRMNGIGVFGEGTTSVIENCTIERNSGDGVLVTDGAVARIIRCRIAGNKQFGVRLKDCGGALTENVLVKNGKGSIQYSLLRDEMLEDHLHHQDW